MAKEPLQDSQLPVIHVDRPVPPREPEATAAPEPSPARRLTVTLALAAVALTFVGTMVVLYCYSCWRSPPAPTSVLIIEDGDLFPDAIVTIEGPWGTLRQKLTREKHYVCRFYLTGGNYTWRMERDGRTILRESAFTIPDQHILTFSLRRAMHLPETRRAQ